MFSCFVPGFDGASASNDSKDALWTSSSRERHDDGGGPSSDTSSLASVRALAKRYGINQKTVAKRKGRASVADLRRTRGAQIQAVMVGFRTRTLLPLDDCL